MLYVNKKQKVSETEGSEFTNFRVRDPGKDVRGYEKKC